MSSAQGYRRDFDLPAVNRSALVLEPTSAYAEWANSCGDGPMFVLSGMIDDDRSVYLIPEMEVGPETWLQQHWPSLFEHELWSWCTDPAYWPRDRSFETFQRFFIVHWHSMVMDVGEGRLASSMD
jgi:hypothetical protein